jgi:16S rRNA (guanine966-N2)-methyltransferase
VLDLFAGTGALGIEAMSRGAGSAVLVEQAAPAVAVSGPTWRPSTSTTR